MAEARKTKKGKSGDAKSKGAKKNKAKANLDNGVEALTRLVDHPLVSDLLAVGAMAAVAAIAEAGTRKAGTAKGDSSKAVKAAGKAAAAAIGQRLLKEVGGLGAKATAKK